MAKFTDHYAALHIPQGALATQDQIKQAYRKAALCTHPDKNTCPSATQAFQDLLNTYEALNTDDKKYAYDITWRAHHQARYEAGRQQNRTTPWWQESEHEETPCNSFHNESYKETAFEDCKGDHECYKHSFIYFFRLFGQGDVRGLDERASWEFGSAKERMEREEERRKQQKESAKKKNAGKEKKKASKVNQGSGDGEMKWARK